MIANDELRNRKQDLVNYIRERQPDIYQDIIDCDAYLEHFSHLDEDEFYNLFICVLDDAGIDYQIHVDKMLDSVILLLSKIDLSLTAQEIVDELSLCGVITEKDMGRTIMNNLSPMINFKSGLRNVPQYYIDKEYFYSQLQLHISRKWWIDLKNIIDIGIRFDKVLDINEFTKEK